MQTRTQHAAMGRKDAFWGVRFCKADDEMVGSWEERGVFCVKMSSYDELPPKLFEICQTASMLWHENLAGN